MDSKIKELEANIAFLKGQVHGYKQRAEKAEEVNEYLAERLQAILRWIDEKEYESAKMFTITAIATLKKVMK